MKIVVGAFIALGLLTSGAALTPHGEDSPPAYAETPPAAADGSERFRLSGPDGSCTVVKLPAAPDGRAPLSIDAACEAILPGLSAAHVWAEGADGSVSFGADDNRTLVQFGVADGAAFESFQPARPPMVLSALD